MFWHISNFKIEAFNSKYWPTCKTTGVRAFWPRRPIRQLAVDRALDHTGSVHLPFFLETKLKEQSNFFRWIFNKSITCKQRLMNRKVPPRKTSGPRTCHHCEHSPAFVSWIQPRTRLAHSADMCSSLDGKYRYKKILLVWTWSIILNHPFSLYCVKINFIV